MALHCVGACDRLSEFPLGSDKYFSVATGSSDPSVEVTVGAIVGTGLDTVIFLLIQTVSRLKKGNKLGYTFPSPLRSDGPNAI
jgi:hypothetical protein